MTGEKTVESGGSRERLRCWLGVMALAVAAASLALVPVQAAGAESPPGVAALAAEIEKRIASLGEQGKANAQARWGRALAAVRCEPGAMSLGEIERRAGKRFNTELWVAVLAAARLCADDALPDAEPAVDPADGGDGGMPPDANVMGSSGDSASVEPAQEPPNRRPTQQYAWPPAVTLWGGATHRLSLSDEFSDPDGDSLSYTVTVSNYYGGGATARIESDELVITTVNTASHVQFQVKATDGSSDCPTSSGGTMECRARRYINVYVRAVPQRSDSDYVDISVRPYDWGVEGLTGVYQGITPQGCVPFTFDLSKTVPQTFGFEYKIITVPETTEIYGHGWSNKGAPASYFPDGLTDVWHTDQFHHQRTVKDGYVLQTSGGFCVPLKGRKSIPRDGHPGQYDTSYADHCPANEHRHFYVEMRIPEYWANLVGVRMVEGKTRAHMNLTCQ